MNDDLDRNRMVLSGHDEARQRLIDMGRSKELVDQLEACTTFYEFAEAVADAVRHDDD